jgi:hypothetical protein
MGLDWLKRVIRDQVATCPLEGWSEVEQTQQMKVWQDVDGDALSFARDVTFGFPDLSDENAVRRRCRELAQDAKAGLVQADVVATPDGPAVMFIYKRLDMPAFVFTGMLVVAPASTSSSVWTIVARERGTTGVREALITANLMAQGKLTPESHKKSWTKDPYDPEYSGVDRRTLRYLSDDESYDSQFPQHPLSKVRRQLRGLLTLKSPPPASFAGG